VNRKGYFIEPAVLVDVNHGMKLMVDESFGPVVGIQKVSSDADAVALMADTEYGLTAAVYSTSYERAEKVMRQLIRGTVYWNCCDRVSASVPWSAESIRVRNDIILPGDQGFCAAEGISYQGITESWRRSAGIYFSGRRIERSFVPFSRRFR